VELEKRVLEVDAKEKKSSKCGFFNGNN